MSVAAGRLITFEGGEGAGKSTQIQRLAASLRAQDLDVVITREPGGTEGAEAIRRLVIEGDADRWAPLTETLLFLAARHDHVTRLIMPALNAGRWVLCDRFIDSTRVYQGLAGTLGLGLIDQLHESILQGLSPDLTLLLDVPVEIGLERRHRTLEVNRFDRRAGCFHDQVRFGFLDLARAAPSRFAVIDGSASMDSVADMVQEEVSRRFADDLASETRDTPKATPP